MRALMLLTALLAAFLGYAGYRDPVGCQKLLADISPIQSSGFGKSRTDAVEPGASLTSGAPSTPQLSSVIEGHLVSSDGSPFLFPAGAPARSLQYIAIYYAFTPVLVDWYKKFKPAHPEFELIFVSYDHDRPSWLSYMKEMAMPWPAFSFSDLQQSDQPITKFAGNGIPDLVLVDAGGKVLSDSFRNGSYVGPQAVVDDINRLLSGTSPVPQP
jgi:hypothetical protein